MVNGNNNSSQKADKKNVRSLCIECNTGAGRRRRCFLRQHDKLRKVLKADESIFSITKYLVLVLPKHGAFISA